VLWHNIPKKMIDNLANLLFRCSHRRITRPVTPLSKAGEPLGDTYVVCLDCGKQFTYDWKQMRILKAVEPSPGSGVLHPEVVKRRKRKVRYALWASAVPLAWLIHKSVKSGKPDRKPPSGDER